MPFHANLCQALAQGKVALVLVASNLVQQQLDLHPALAGALEGLEEDIRDLVPGLDVDLNEHVFLGAIHSPCHGHDGLVIGSVHTLVVSNECRVPGEVAVELDK